MRREYGNYLAAEHSRPLNFSSVNVSSRYRAAAALFRSGIASLKKLFRLATLRGFSLRAIAARVEESGKLPGKWRQKLKAVYQKILLRSEAF